MKCIMGFCKNIMTYDRLGRNPRNPKSNRLCDDCLTLLDKVKHRSHIDPIGSFPRMVTNMISRAKTRNKYEVKIKPQDIYNIWPSDNKCPIMGTEFIRGEPRNNSPSLDRIDNDKGYVPGNIQIISNLANKMKHNATKEQLERFCKYYGQDDSAASSQGCS